MKGGANAHFQRKVKFDPPNKKLRVSRAETKWLEFEKRIETNGLT